MKINAAWHKNHPMPKNPTEYQRAEWHIHHQENCGCRPIPQSVLRYIKKGKKMPARHTRRM